MRNSFNQSQHVEHESGGLISWIVPLVFFVIPTWMLFGFLTADQWNEASCDVISVSHYRAYDTRNHEWDLTCNYRSNDGISRTATLSSRTGAMSMPSRSPQRNGENVGFRGIRFGDTMTIRYRLDNPNTTRLAMNTNTMTLLTVVPAIIGTGIYIALISESIKNRRNAIHGIRF